MSNTIYIGGLGGIAFIINQETVAAFWPFVVLLILAAIVSDLTGWYTHSRYFYQQTVLIKAVKEMSALLLKMDSDLINFREEFTRYRNESNVNLFEREVGR